MMDSTRKWKVERALLRGCQFRDAHRGTHGQPIWPGSPNHPVDVGEAQVLETHKIYMLIITR